MHYNKVRFNVSVKVSHNSWGIYHRIPQITAEENAKAVQGLKPHDAGSQVASLAPIIDIYQKGITK